MATLGPNRWGKSEVRLSKVHHGSDGDDISDITARILLEGDVDDAFLEGDNAAVVPTDTMRNTVYGLAQEHLTKDLEAFAGVLADHFVAKDGVSGARIELAERPWARVTSTGFTGGGSESRTAWLEAGHNGRTYTSGIEGLVVLKTSGSAFVGFPQDEYTILPEATDRLLATSVTTHWLYSTVPPDTSRAWTAAREAILSHFFSDWSASVQHQGWLMAQAALEAVPEIQEIEFRLPNQHHLPFHLERFGLEDRGVVFNPVAEPYGDISFVVRR
jgi:urate oxidase